MHWHGPKTLFIIYLIRCLGQVSLISNANDNYAIAYCVRGIDERHTRHDEPGSASPMLFI
jgi:hypothetical protein